MWGSECGARRGGPLEGGRRGPENAVAQHVVCLQPPPSAQLPPPRPPPAITPLPAPPATHKPVLARAAHPWTPSPPGRPASMAFCPTTGSHGFFATLLALLQVRRRWRGNLERCRRARPQGLTHRLPAAARPPSSVAAMWGKCGGAQAPSEALPPPGGAAEPARQLSAVMGPFPPTGWRAPETSAALPPLPTTDCPVDSHRGGGQRGALDLEGTLQMEPQVGAAAAHTRGAPTNPAAQTRRALAPCCVLGH